MCSLLAGPSAFSVFFRLPLSSRPWGEVSTVIAPRAQTRPQRQRPWGIGSSPSASRRPPQPPPPRPTLAWETTPAHGLHHWQKKRGTTRPNIARSPWPVNYGLEPPLRFKPMTEKPWAYSWPTWRAGKIADYNPR